MSTEYVGLPAPLLQKAKDAAAQEHITVEELIQDAVERRLGEKSFSHLFAIGDRNVKRTGARPENVETEIQAHRSERKR